MTREEGGQVASLAGVEAKALRVRFLGVKEMVRLSGLSRTTVFEVERGRGHPKALLRYLNALKAVTVNDPDCANRLKRLESQVERGGRGSGVQLEQLTPDAQGLVVGRDSVIRALDRHWRSKNTHLVTLVGEGGAGKTTVMWKWLARVLRARDDGTRVFGWSFRAAGRDNCDSADEFLDSALRWFGGPRAAATIKRGATLARLLGQEKALLVLDALEPLVSPAGPDAGQIRDLQLRELLFSLAAENPGLCLVTVRPPFRALDRFHQQTVFSFDLGPLPRADSVALLRALGVKGAAGTLARAAARVLDQPLGLTLLGTYLHRRHQGDARLFGDVVALEQASAVGQRTREVMLSYERWLAGRPEATALRVLGLFDRPASPAALSALLDGPPIPGLCMEPGEALGSDRRRWLDATANLRELRLLLPPGDDEPEALDAHPLVRDFFSQQLQQQQPDAYREANLRLFEHYLSAGVPVPDSIAELTPYYAAMVHACRAGLHEQAIVRVFQPFIWQGRRWGEGHKSGEMLGVWMRSPGLKVTAGSGVKSVLGTAVPE